MEERFVCEYTPTVKMLASQARKRHPVRVVVFLRVFLVHATLCTDVPFSGNMVVVFPDWSDIFAVVAGYAGDQCIFSH